MKTKTASKKIVVNKNLNIDDILKPLEELYGQEIDIKNVYVKHLTDILNLSSLLHLKDLTDIIYDDVKFEIVENHKEGLVNIMTKFNVDIRSFEFKKDCKIGVILNEIGKAYDINMDSYYLKGIERNFDLLDANEIFSEQCNEIFVEFEILKMEKKVHKVCILAVTDDYNKQRRKNSIYFNTEETPTTKDIVKFCENEFGKEEKELSFFKLNAFDDPIKRINIKNFSVKNLEIEGSVRVMVKNTPDRLDFELMSLQIFTTTDYAVNEEKRFTIKVPMDAKISVMKQMIIDEMIVQGLLEENSKPADYLFQNLNIYNVPSKYFINENSLVKKHIFRSNKVLVRKNDKGKPIEKYKICLFLRKRDSKSRTYGKRIEFLHNGNKRNINTKNYEAFKKTIYDAIDDEEKKGLDCFELAIVDYKHFQWKSIKNNFTCLKDGDEIGYILDINENKGDDLQTTYLSNLSKSHDVSGETVYIRMTEEKGFLIKPKDSK